MRNSAAQGCGRPSAPDISRNDPCACVAIHWPPLALVWLASLVPGATTLGLRHVRNGTVCTPSTRNHRFYRPFLGGRNFLGVARRVRVGAPSALPQRLRTPGRLGEAMPVCSLSAAVGKATANSKAAGHERTRHRRVGPMVRPHGALFVRLGDGQRRRQLYRRTLKLVSVIGPAGRTPILNLYKLAAA